MIKRYLFAALLAVMGGGLLFSQVRESVYIVRPHRSEKAVNTIQKAIDKLKQENYTDLAEHISKQLEKEEYGFGSGFIITGPDNNKYLVTNRHVVIDAGYVSLESQRIDSTHKIEKAEIIAIDDDLDLALIKLPSDEQLGPGFKFFEGTLKDGDAVISAGYPALGDNPVWQIAKGYVTNVKVVLDEIVDKERSVFIQHSAQIDSGNSGGPLLVQDSKNPDKYYVAGVNTLKATFRENTNFAIPLKQLKDFIKRSFDSSEETKNSRLQKRLEDFISDLKEKDPDDTMLGARKLARYISIEYVEEKGTSLITDILAYAPTDAANEIAGTFYVSPIEGMRLAIAYDIYNRLVTEEEAPELKPTDEMKVSLDDNNADIKLSADTGEEISTTWIYEQNTWRLKDSSIAGEQTAAQTQEETDTDTKEPVGFKFSLEEPYNVGVTLGYKYYFSDLRKIYFNFTRAISVVGLGWDAGMMLLDNGESTEPFAIPLDLYLRLQFPIESSSITLLPYFKAYLGTILLGEENYTGIQGGLEIVLIDTFLIDINIGQDYFTNNAWTYAGVSIGLGGTTW